MAESGDLVLIYGDLEVTLQLYSDNGYSRDMVNFSTHERSIYGTVAIRRHLYESPLVWTISDALLLKEDAQRLDLMVRKAAKAWDTADGSILIYDLVEEWVEEGSQSRSIVPEQFLENRTDGSIAYYAQFNVQLAELKVKRTGRDDDRLVSFVMTELERA